MANLYDFVSESRLFRKFELNELLFVEYRCLVEDAQSRIWSPNNYFAYVLGGKKKWKVPGVEFLAQPGDALFVRKGAHEVHQYFREDFVVLFLFVPDQFIRQVVEKYALPIPEKPSAEQTVTEQLMPLAMDKSLHAYFQSMLTYFGQAKPPPPSLLQLKFEELLIHLMEHSSNTAIARYFGSLCRQNGSSIRAVMEANFYSPLSLEEFARLCARSLSSFKREFKVLYGTTPGRWLLEKRLAYGRFLLETTDKMVYEVAYEAGFKNRSHFTQAFKEKFGASPIELRKGKIKSQKDAG